MKSIILLSVLAVALAGECGENQHYEECGTACPITCENYDDPPLFCIKLCVPGCHCDEGFVKTKDGRCVEPALCPAQAECGENARFHECGSACPLTCDNYDNPPKMCPAMCVSGCHCEKGFVQTEEGRCVRPENCPARADSRCSLQSDKGRCRGYIERYYYNQQNRRCEKFIYGGCGGNRNNFKTRDECRRSCGSHDHGRDNGHNHGH